MSASGDKYKATIIALVTSDPDLEPASHKKILTLYDSVAAMPGGHVVIKRNAWRDLLSRIRKAKP